VAKKPTLAKLGRKSATGAMPNQHRVDTGFVVTPVPEADFTRFNAELPVRQTRQSGATGRSSGQGSRAVAGSRKR
jgi:hypothetical protein